MDESKMRAGQRVNVEKLSSGRRENRYAGA
jgi:hypothetical protein